MSTTNRSDLSKKNKWWISHYRYLELKNYCRQYPEWQANYNYLTHAYPTSADHVMQDNIFCDRVSEIAMKRIEIRDKIIQLETTAREADETIWTYILKAVINNYSYDYLRCQLNVPCGKDYYYDKYRKFFWLLSQKRK